MFLIFFYFTKFSETSKIFRPHYGTGTEQVSASKGESTTDCTGLPPHHISTNEFTLVYIICSKSPHPTWLHTITYILVHYSTCMYHIHKWVSPRKGNKFLVGLKEIGRKKILNLFFLLVLIYSL